MLPRNQGESKNYVNINKKNLFGKIDVRLRILHIPVVAGDRENYLYAVDRFLPCFCHCELSGITRFLLDGYDSIYHLS